MILKTKSPDRLFRLAIGVAIAIISNHASAQFCHLVSDQSLPISELESNDNFGSEIAVSGDVMGVVSRWDGTTVMMNGTVFMYRRSASGWEMEQTIEVPNDQFNTNFGNSIAISGDVMVVGARQDRDLGTNAGAVYVFRNNASGWELESKLTASDGGIGEFFGDAVAVEENTIVVGVRWSDSFGPNRGAAYVFEFDGVQWNQTSILPRTIIGQANYGNSVAIANQLIVVSEPYYSAFDENQFGALHVYTKDASQHWVRAQSLIADADEYTHLGESIAMSGDRLIATSNESVQIYRVVNGAFEHETTLPQAAQTVDIAGPYAIMGDQFRSEFGYTAGIVFQYAFDGSAWNYKNVFSPPGIPDRDHFGASVAIDGQQFYMGSPGTGDWGAVFTGQEPLVCRADMFRNCMLDFIDVSYFIQGYLNQDPISDFSGDGLFTFIDISAFLSEFGSGCP